MDLMELCRKLEELRKNSPYPSSRSLIMPALWIVEKNFPSITEEHMNLIADVLGVKPIEVEEVAYFYAMYHTKKRGKYVVRICTNLSCMLNKGEEILEAVCSYLKVKKGETTKDGLFTVEEAECMGLCDGAPAMTINEKRYTNLTPEKAVEIIKKLMEKERDGESNSKERG